ncbi:MAG: YggS family pyridoxal phosphate-dependent enzyme [Ruminococcus sp.]|nr:YggS family pyridoxal phosphate-dependent enzyme [Ruminococcus sp.]
MGSDFRYIDENLKQIQYNISEAAAKYRSPEDRIRLMAVTKTVSYEAVNHAVSLGVELLGENRVQEYQSKKDFYSKSAEVHFIGHLQTNKVKYIINTVSMIQSVGSVKLASEINRLAEANGRIMDVLCEVNIGGEESKSGISPVELYELLERASEMKNIRVCGLMTIPPPVESDIYLGRMQELFCGVRAKNIGGIEMNELSMGMTHDYAAAVKYGSTLVRIGTGLFGARNYNK